jgi:hypothetical protein
MKKIILGYLLTVLTTKETAMRYRLALIVCFLSSALLGQEIEEEYCLTGIEDSLSYRVAIKQDLANEIATFRLQNYTLDIFGVQDINSIELHANAFLEVQFRIRGGSGVSVRRTILLCVSQGRIYRSLDVLSEVTSRLNKVYNKMADSLKLFDEKEDYLITLSIESENDGRYKAVLFESTKVESKYDPSRNISFEKRYELEFDPGQFFFYNSMKQLNKRYKIHSSKENKTVEKSINEEVPCIQLYEKRYLRIENQWCLDNGHDSLSCL